MGKIQIEIVALTLIIAVLVIYIKIIESKLKDEIKYLDWEMSSRTLYNSCDICKFYVYNGKDLVCTETGKKNCYTSSCDYWCEKDAVDTNDNPAE